MSSMDSEKNIVATKTTIQRLLRDVRQLIKNPLTDNGIYYIHDEENIFRGYALIVGPSDTPYFGGYYFFKIEYPNNYPFAPPKVTYCTNNGYTRFNPNLYTNGKVCVSILNTWGGDEWSACQTISSVLLVLCSLLNNEPLVNEPGHRKTDAFFQPYYDMIEYENINTAICGIITGKYLISPFESFMPQIHEHFNKNIDKIMEFVEKKAKEPVKNYNNGNIYSMSGSLDYQIIKNRLMDVKKLIQK
jgi:ubiquitin-protein ligase